MKKIIFVIPLIFFCFECKEISKPNSKNTINAQSLCSQTIEDLMVLFLNKPIKIFIDNRKCYLLKDTTIISDEDATWIAKAAYVNNKLEFLVETSWIDTVNISRITFVGSTYSTQTGIKVGDSVSNLINYVDIKIPSEPDGYLLLKDKLNNIFYEIDISQNPELAINVSDLSKIPKNLKINSIIVN